MLQSPLKLAKQPVTLAAGRCPESSMLTNVTAALRFQMATLWRLMEVAIWHVLETQPKFVVDQTELVFTLTALEE